MAVMKNLWQLGADWDAVSSMLYDEDVPEEVIFDTLEAIEAAIDDKADAYARIIGDMECNINAIEAEEKRLRARRASLESRKKFMQNNLMENMRKTGRTKFKTNLYSFNIAKNGGRRALVLDVLPEQLPHTLRTIQYVANNDAIREFMGDEESCQFAHLAEQGEHLSIR